MNYDYPITIQLCFDIYTGDGSAKLTHVAWAADLSQVYVPIWNKANMSSYLYTMNVEHSETIANRLSIYLVRMASTPSKFEAVVEIPESMKDSGAIDKHRYRRDIYVLAMQELAELILACFKYPNAYWKRNRYDPDFPSPVATLPKVQMDPDPIGKMWNIVKLAEDITGTLNQTFIKAWNKIIDGIDKE